jgi:hypothetical protein
MSISKINTILAVFRVPFVIRSLEEVVPSVWTVLLEVLEERLVDMGVIASGITFPPSTPLESIILVIERLQILTGITLDHLDAPGILHKRTEKVAELADLYWELFKTIEASNSLRLDPSKMAASDRRANREFEESLMMQEPQHLDEAIPPKERSPILSREQSSDTSAEQSSTIRKGRLELSAEEINQMGLGPIRDSGRQRSRSTSPVKKKSKKNLRFQFKTPDVPTVKRSEMESSRLKALRLQKTNIEKKTDTKGRFQDRISKEVEDLIHQHKNITGIKWKPPSKSFAFDKMEPTLEQSMLEATVQGGWNQIEEYVSAIMDEDENSDDEAHNEKVDYPPRSASMTERNLNSFMQQVTDAVPLTKPFPATERERAWKAQLKLSRKALDDRIWTQRVVMVISLP